MKRTPERYFSDMFVAELEKHAEFQRYEVDAEDPFEITAWGVDTDNPSHFYLGNIFAESRELPPEEKRERMRRLLEPVSEKEETWDEVCDSLVPLVRPGQYAAVMLALRRTFLPHLHLLVGVDYDHSITVVCEEQREVWGVSEQELFDTALAMLASHHDDNHVESFDDEAPFPIWYVSYDDAYEASRLALPGFLASFRGRVHGNPIAVIPSNQLLVVSGDGDPEACLRLAEFADREFYAAPRPLSTAVYTVDESGEVVPFHLPSQHPAHVVVERGHRLLALIDYAEQKERLDEELEAGGIDLYVAKLDGFENEEGMIRTYCTWPEDVDCLLPDSDVIALCGGEPDAPSFWACQVDAAEVFRLASHCLQHHDTYEPPRYRTVQWPEPEILDELKSLALDA